MRKVLMCICGLAMATMTITGCGGGGGGSAPPSVPAKLTAEKYPVAGSITDPAGAPISGTVTLSAEDKNGAAVSLYSDKTGGTLLTTAAVPADGMISFYVADTAAVAANLPVTVKAVVTKAGWVSSSTTFTVTAAGTSSFTVKLVDTTTPTAGVVSGTASAAAGAALTTTVTAPVETKTSASVAIPSATVLTNSSGAPLTGTVTTVATTFAPPTTTYPVFTDANLITCIPLNDTLADPDVNCVVGTSALESFPGGMGVAQSATDHFVTAGFVAVSTTDATGKDAKSSSAPFTIRLDIPAGTYNDSGVLVAAGDSIPVWTYDETEAVWKAEMDSSVPPAQVLGLVQTDAGQLYVTHTTNHFSFWNLGWKKTGCSGTLNLTGDAVAMQLILTATPAKGGALKTAVKPPNDATVTATQIPTGLLDVVLTDSLKRVIAKTKGVDWCGAPNQTISMGYIAPVAKKPVPVTVKVQESCIQNPAVTRPVPSVITYVNDNNNKIKVSTGTTDTAGQFVHNLPPASYFFYAYNRRTLKYDKTALTPVVAATPKTILFDTPVQCIVSGTSGGTTTYGF